MRKLITINAVFIFSVSLFYGQKQKKDFINSNQLLINRLTEKVDKKWIRNNALLQPTKSSFFNRKNADNYYVGLLEISGNSVPFTWDSNLTLLKYLFVLDNKIEIKQGVKANRNFQGTKISWPENKYGLIWFNEKTYKAMVDNWYLIGLNECPDTINFPNLSFKKIEKISNVITNNIQGLTIFPYSNNLKIKQKEKSIYTMKNEKIEGFAFDVNDDNIFDIFYYNEVIDEKPTYTRLYLNIEGQWKCKWIYLNEECI